MLKKVLLVTVLVVVVCSFGAINVFASDESPNVCQMYNADEGLTVPGYCDGRLNATDIDQPVAVYYTYDKVQAYDSNGNGYLTDAISGIQLWAVGDNSNGYQVLNVPLAQITSVISGATQNVQIAANGEYTLNYSPAGDAFWITGPDGYSFVWEAW